MQRQPGVSTSWAIISSEAIVGRARKAWTSLKKPCVTKPLGFGPMESETSSKTSIARSPAGFGFFQHSHWTTFKPLDQWIRQRLRSILRKRHKGSGRARGIDHQRWPNAYFVELGLISLASTRAQAAISQREH